MTNEAKRNEDTVEPLVGSVGILPRFRVMICDQFIDIHATTEDMAKAVLLQRIKDGLHELALIAWQDDGGDDRTANDKAETRRQTPPERNT